MQRLTDRGIAALKPLAGKPYFVFDAEVSGLAIKIYPSGQKSFVFDWRAGRKQHRRIIGRFPVWAVGKARIHAGKMRLRADVGDSVMPARGGKVADLIAQWQETVVLTRRAGTAAAYRNLITAHIIPIFGKDDPKAITRNAVEHWHGGIAQATPTHANRALAVLSSFMSWLEHDHKIERNPCKGVKRRPETQRQILLDAAEIIAAHRALDAETINRPAALALRLALLTGCRIGEALSLTTAQLDTSRKLWIKPATATKQKKLHIVPLQPEALEVAQELLSLPMPGYDSCSRAWERARTIIGREDVRIHDLRHSRASALARGGASLPQIGKVLGHTSPVTTQRYLHLVDADLVDLIERS